MEDEINSLYKVIDEANLNKTDLEGQIESLKQELGFLSRSYEEVGGTGLAVWATCVSAPLSQFTAQHRVQRPLNLSSLLAKPCRRKCQKVFLSPCSGSKGFQFSNWSRTSEGSNRTEQK